MQQYSCSRTEPGFAVRRHWVHACVESTEAVQVATEGDAFIVAFHSVTDAIRWAMHVQTDLLGLLWPDAFEEKHVLSCARSVKCDGQLIFSGLRVRMAIESGPVATRTADELTGRLRIDGVCTALICDTTGSCCPARRVSALLHESVADAVRASMFAVGACHVCRPVSSHPWGSRRNRRWWSMYHRPTVHETAFPKRQLLLSPSVSAAAPLSLQGMTDLVSAAFACNKKG